jgi:hypothetical protein
MKNRDCELRVKYSIIMEDENGKNRLLKKKTKKKFTSGNTPIILDKIDIFENELENQKKVSYSHSSNQFSAYLKKFIRTWKHTYYEMLNI